MSLLSRLFATKPKCEHDWQLQYDKVYNMTYTDYWGDEYVTGEQIHKVYICSKCLQVKHIKIKT